MQTWCTWLLLEKLKQILESICQYSGLLRIVEMRRHHPVPHPHPHHQPQLQQPLDLLPSAVSERGGQRMDGGGLPVRDDTQQVSRLKRWLSSTRHSRTIVFVILAVSLLLNATIISLVWWRWNAGCPPAQPRCSDNHVSWCTAAYRYIE